MNPKLEKLLKDQPALWRGADITPQRINGISTGFTELDAVLPRRGWPADALLEIVTSQWGIGELRLLLPSMAQLSRRGLWIIWIAPPYLPYAPALLNGGIDLNRNLILTPKGGTDEILWSMEKVLCAQACGMVLAWPQRLAGYTVRRLQLAAGTGRSLGILFQAENRPSAAALRIRLQGNTEALPVDILKAQGGKRPATVVLRP